MAAAARIGDPIGHSPAMKMLMGGLLGGLVAGAAIALVGVAIVGTGGLAAVAIVGAGAALGATSMAGLGEAASGLSVIPKEVTGAIAGVCSFNVFTNGRPAARSHVDFVACTKHPAPPAPIATGSAQVYINGEPAARVDDKTGCGAVITDGSSNVYIGGGTKQTDTIHPEDLVPGWVHTTLLVVGTGAAAVLFGPVVAIGGLIVGVAGGYAGGWVGGKLFGEGSDGQILMSIGGSMLGGWRGGKSAPGVFNYVRGKLPGLPGKGRPPPVVPRDGPDAPRPNDKVYRQDNYMKSHEGAVPGRKKSHVNADGDLSPADPSGNATPTQHVRGSEPVKSKSPYTSFSESNAGGKNYGDSTITLDLKRLQADVAAGKVPGVEIISHDALLGMHDAAIASARARYNANPTPKNLERVDRATMDRQNSVRDSEVLIRGVIPKEYLDY